MSWNMWKGIKKTWHFIKSCKVMTQSEGFVMVLKLRGFSCPKRSPERCWKIQKRSKNVLECKEMHYNFCKIIKLSPIWNALRSCFLTKKISDPNFYPTWFFFKEEKFGSKTFLTQNFFTQNFFLPIYFVIQKFFWLKFFEPINLFNPKIFFT